MKTVGSIHAYLALHAKDFSLSSLAHGDVPRQIRLAIADTADDRQWRTSPLPRDLVFWLLLAMALHRGRSIPDAFAMLLSEGRGRRLGFPLQPVTDGALAHARKRLGPDPLKAFFESMASRIQPPPSFHGLAVWALDGTRITLADQPANEREFGRPPQPLWEKSGRRLRKPSVNWEPPFVTRMTTCGPQPPGRWAALVNRPSSNRRVWQPQPMTKTPWSAPTP